MKSDRHCSDDAGQARKWKHLVRLRADRLTDDSIIKCDVAGSMIALGSAALCACQNCQLHSASAPAPGSRGRDPKTGLLPCLRSLDLMFAAHNLASLASEHALPLSKRITDKQAIFVAEFERSRRTLNYDSRNFPF